MINNRIKELRKDKGLQQEALGIALGTTQQTISKIENGKYNIPIDLLIAITRYFNVTSDYILGISDEKRSLDGQKEGNQTNQEYCDLLIKYKNLDEKDKKTLCVMLEHLEKKHKKKDDEK